MLQIQIQFRRRVKDEIKRLKDESTHNDMVEEARPGDAAWVKAIWQEHMDLEKFFSKGAMENVYLQPEMLFTKMPRDPGNERANAMHNIHDQVRFLTELFELHQGEIREVCAYWDRVAMALPNHDILSVMVRKSDAFRFPQRSVPRSATIWHAPRRSDSSSS